MSESATVEPVGTGEDEAFWYRGCEQCSETGQAWQGGEEFGECETCSGRGFIWAALDDILEGIHPALPAVARWLVEHPGAGEAMRRIVNNAWYETPCEPDDLDWLHALAKALTGGEGAGGEPNQVPR